MDKHCDRQLVDDIRKGSREAFERFLDVYEDRVYGVVRRSVGPEDAEDVAQEALVQIYQSIGSFQGRSSLSTWVYRVTMNVCLEHRRKHSPEVVPIEDVSELPSGECGPEKGAIRTEVRREVESAIAALSEVHRDVVIMHELEQLTYQECAEVLGCPVGTVKSRLSNAFSKLRELLKDYAPEGGLPK
jgi:RNA polymerase sigma-70 factor (ECF subfamily)